MQVLEPCYRRSKPNHGHAIAKLSKATTEVHVHLEVLAMPVAAIESTSVLFVIPELLQGSPHSLSKLRRLDGPHRRSQREQLLGSGTCNASIAIDLVLAYCGSENGDASIEFGASPMSMSPTVKKWVLCVVNLGNSDDEAVARVCPVRAHVRETRFVFGRQGSVASEI